MKNSLLRITVLLFILAILWNCQKTEEQSEFLKESLSITEAKDWYDKNLKYESSYSDLFRSNSADSTVFDLKPLLNWDLAELDNDSIWSVVELAWEYQDGFVEIATSEVKQQSERDQTDIIQVQKLVILKNKLTGDMYGFKMLVIPNLSYILSSAENINTNYYLRRDPAFSGLILFYSVKDDFINGWEYNHGKIISKVLKESSPSEVSTANYHKVASGFVTYAIETCTYIQISMGDFTSEPQLSHCKTDYFSTYLDDGYSDGGGGGVSISGVGSGTNPNTNTTPSDPTTTLTDPCAEFQKMIADDSLNAKLKEYILKAERDSLEDGYMKTALGSKIKPSERTRINVSFDPYTDKIIERVHIHPDMSGGTYVFSPRDLLTLHSMFIKGKMFNPATFRYIVVSIYGIGILHITDPVKFKEFGNKFNEKSLKGLYDDLAMEKDGNDINDSLKWFLKILKESDSGLSFSLGEFTKESSEISDIKWTPYQLDSKNNVTKKDCN
ncbi:MAG: hypothetical protein PHU68_08750 [Paludibacter sp.]|nr:hypothetical protein [Paludibacter sp.]